uniref:Uncharacterized protein n=1 Tax=Oncorhynchus mykiss TaxID=8022 RepID=A0A8C7VM97_ONCMY
MENSGSPVVSRPRAREAGVKRLAPQHVLLDELVARASVQTELQPTVLLRKVKGVLRHADGKGKVAAHPAHYYGRPDVAGLDLHQAAPGAVLCGGLVHLLLRTAMVRLEDHRYLKDTNKEMPKHSKGVILC